MALTFPSSPSNGQIYADTTTGNRYIYNATAGVWSFAANNVGMSVSSTPPSNVAPGAMWFNREIGRTFVYYDDGDSKQWIETVPAGAVDTNTIAAYTNPIFASMNGAYTTANAALQNANTTLAGSLITTRGIYAQGTLPASGSGLANGVYIGTQGDYGTVEIVGNAGSLVDFGKFGADYFGRILYDNASNTMSIGAISSVNFNTAGSDRMRIDSSGNLGIGTSSPAVRLDVQQPGNQIAKFVATAGVASGYISINNTGGDFHLGRENSSGTTFGLTAYSSVLWAGGSYPLIAAVNGAERMRIDSSGRVTMSYQPAFRVTKGGNVRVNNTSGSTQSIIWDDTTSTNRFNVGGHYSTSTGRFTAPIAGRYQFHCMLFTNSSASALGAIHCNDVLVSYWSGNRGVDANNSDLGMMTSVILNLAAGDYVTCGNFSGQQYHLNDTGSHFSGYLLG